MSGWSNGIVDFDNDGWKDLFVARGNVLDNISELSPARQYAEPNSIFRNLGNGKFEEVRQPPARTCSRRSASRRGLRRPGQRWTHRRGRLGAERQAEILHNITETGNHWLLLKLVGTKSNRMGLGAQIHIVTPDGKSQWNEVTTSVGYASSSDRRVHFGLGSNTIKEIEIRWPSGIKQILRNVEGDRVVTVEEPRQ